PCRCRRSTASYSTTRGTETAISKFRARRCVSSAYDAPLRDLQGATRPDVSRTTRTFQWYHLRYRGARRGRRLASPALAVGLEALGKQRRTEQQNRLSTMLGETNSRPLHSRSRQVPIRRA